MNIIAKLGKLKVNHQSSHTMFYLVEEQNQI